MNFNIKNLIYQKTYAYYYKLNTLNYFGLNEIIKH